MMYIHRLLLISLVCLYLTTIASAIQCYLGADQFCLLAPDFNDCGLDETCQCAKYRFKCTENDHACNKEEQENQKKKLAYTILSARTCETMKTLSHIYEELSCCSTDKCNQPDNGQCSWPEFRRRALHKLYRLI